MAKEYIWKISIDGPPFQVLDWAERWHTFQNRDDAVEFVERDKRMFARASKDANDDVLVQMTNQFEQPGDGLESDGEQAVEPGSETETASKGHGGQANRESRRRAARAANRKKGSR